MTEEQIKKAAAVYETKLREWAKSQEGQQDGYEYEKSFVEFTRASAQETLKITVEDGPDSKDKKKE
jgi:hypothetical protein